MSQAKKTAIIGNLLILLLALQPLALGIIVAFRYLDSECPGALIRPSFWLMTNGFVQSASLIMTVFLLTMYLIFGHRYVLWSHLGFAGISLFWYVAWGIVGILSMIFRSSDCDANSGNHMMVIWIGFNMAYNIIVLFACGLFGWSANLLTEYHEMVNDYGFLP